MRRGKEAKRVHEKKKKKKAPTNPKAYFDVGGTSPRDEGAVSTGRNQFFTRCMVESID